MSKLEFSEMEPIFPDQPMWGAKHGSFTFIITKDDDKYSASVKELSSTPFDGKRHDLGGYQAYNSLEDAKQACENFLARKN